MTAAGSGYAAAIVLALLFVVAAVTKARDVGATARSFTALGVPNAATLARIVPAVEVVIAVGLVASPAIGGAAALMTLAFFTTFLASRLRAGVHAPCACFGSATSEPLSVVKLVDNVFLVVMAIGATAAARPTTPTLFDVGAVAVLIAVGIVAHVLLDRSRRPA